MLAEPVFNTALSVSQERKLAGTSITAAADAAAATDVHSHDARATPGRAAAAW